MISCEPHETVSEQGEPADALYMVRSGFFKTSQKTGAGQRAVSYVSKGGIFGEVEFLIEDSGEWRFSVSSTGHSELVRIPFDHLRTVLKEYPVLEKRLWETAVETIKETGSTLRSLAKSELLAFSLEQGLVEGNSILVIDLNTCTRCDDCVRACAETHGGRPRFVREGEKYDNFLVTQACYHCQDPVCLVGCPTGAIRRANVSSVVEINEDICIGCGSCGSNCPYDAIVLQDTGQNWGPAAIPKSLRGDRRFVASKCDLCYTSDQGPACVRNCPHGSAVRVGSTEEFQRLLEKEPSS